MSDSFKRTALGLFAFTPEVTQGTKNNKFEASGGTTTTATVDTTDGLEDDNAIASAADDFFNGLYMYFDSATTTADLQGQVYPITDFAVSGGTATFTTTTTMAAAPADTDTFWVLGYLQASSVSLTVGYENLTREMFERQTLDGPSSEKGLKVASGTMNIEIWGLEQENGSGDTPTPDVMSKFLEAVGERRAVAGTTVSGAGSTTTVVDVTSAANFQVDDLVLINNEVRQITAVDTASTPDNITVAPALSAAPADTDEVFFGELFTPYDSGHLSHTISCLADSQLFELTGAVFSVGASATYGALTQMQVEFDAESWDMTDSSVLDGQQSTKKALPYTLGEVFFGSTEICVNNFNFTLGQGRQLLRDTCAGQRQFVTSRAATMQVVFRNTGVTPKETWEANGTQDRLLVQVGNTAGAAVAFCGNAQIQDPSNPLSDVEGHRFYDATFAYVDDQTDAANADKPLIARF